MQLRDKLLDRLYDLIGQKQTYNILVDEYSLSGFEEYLRQEDVREALHVGEIKFTLNNGTAHRKLFPDFLVEIQPNIEELLERYRVLIYWSVSNGCRVVY